MHIVKVILMVVGIGVLIFTLMLVYLFVPGITDVSDKAVLKPYVGKIVRLTRKAYLFRADQGSYRFNENVLVEGERYAGEAILLLEPGSEIRITQFKTYYNKIGSGLTSLFALGTIRAEGNAELPFEYYMGSVGKSFYEDEPFDLPLLLWQDGSDRRIRIQRPD